MATGKISMRLGLSLVFVSGCFLVNSLWSATPPATPAVVTPAATAPTPTQSVQEHLNTLNNDANQTATTQPAAPTAVTTPTTTQVDKPKHKKHAKHHRHHSYSDYHNDHLRHVIAYTLRTNPDVLQTEAEARAAGTKINQSVANYLPKVDVSYGQGKEDALGPFTLFAESKLNRKERTLNASQLLWDGWGTLYQIQNSIASFKSSLFQIAEKKQLTALRVVETYLDTIRYARIIALSRYDVAYNQDTLHKVQLRFQGGAGQKSDVELARSRLAYANSTLLSAHGSLEDAKANYIQVVGKPPYRLAMPATPHLPATLDHALRIAMFNSPSLKVAKHKLIAAMANVDVANSAFYPKVTLEGSVTKDRNIGGLVGISNDKLVMIQVRYNLFRGFGDISSSNEAVHQVAAAHAALLTIHRTVRQNVRSAWYDYHFARQRAYELSQRVTTIHNVLIDYQKQFSLGQRSLLNLEDIERELYNAQVELVDTQFQAVGNAYRLLASMGVLAHEHCCYRHYYS